MGCMPLKHFCYIAKYDCREKKHSSDWFELPDELMANIMLFRLEVSGRYCLKMNKVSLSI